MRINYDTELQLYSEMEGGMDEDNIYTEGNLQLVKTIMANIQSYNAELSRKSYGYEAEEIKRIFTAPDDSIKPGDVLKQDSNNAFEVNKILRWENFMELMCIDAQVPK